MNQRMPLIISTPTTKYSTGKEWLENFLFQGKIQTGVSILDLKQVSQTLSARMIKTIEQQSEYKKSNLNNNEVFREAVSQLSSLILTFSYSPFLKSNIKPPCNLIAFFEMVKYFIHQKSMCAPTFLKQQILSHLYETLLTRTHFSYFQEIQQEKSQSELYGIFLNQVSHLIISRIKTFAEVFKISIQQYAQKLFDFLLIQRDEQQQANAMHIDYILLCAVNLTFIIHKKQVIFGKICDIYQASSKTKVNRKKVLELYNSYFLKLHENNQFLVNKVKQIEVQQPILQGISCLRMQEEQTILDFQ